MSKKEKQGQDKRQPGLGPRTPKTNTRQRRTRQRRGSNQVYEDINQLLSEFYLEPNLEEHGFDQDKFGHINKNLVVTALSRKHGEHKKVLRQLNSIQVLLNYNKTRWLAEEIVVGEEDGEKVQRYGDLTEVSERRAAKLIEHPEYDGRVTLETNNRFDRALNVFFGNVYGQTAVSAGTGSSLIRNLNTDIGEQKQDIKHEQQGSRRGFLGKTKDYITGNNRRR